MRIYHVLEKIENAIYNSRKVPLSDYALIHRDKILKLIEKTRDNLPEEMKRARWVSKENQRILQEAQTKAGEIVREAENRSKELLREAKEESLKLLDKESIVVNAKNRADEILEEARMEAEKIFIHAREKSTQMVRKAEMTAEDLTYRSNLEAKRVKKGADDYAWRILSKLEAEFSSVHGILRTNLDQMREMRQKEKEREAAMEKAKTAAPEQKKPPAPPAGVSEKQAQSTVVIKKENEPANPRKDEKKAEAQPVQLPKI